MKVNTILKSCFFAAVVTASGLFIGCTPEEVTSGNPLTQANIDATFSGTTTDGNRYSFTSSDDDNIQYHTWKMTIAGDPEGSDDGETVGTSTYNRIFVFPGTYTIQHRVVGRTGGTNSVTEQTYTVTTTALEDNILKSPNFETPADWTVLNISGTATNWTFNNGSATIMGGSSAQQGIYQAVNVVKGDYILDMHVEGSGATNTWFEVYLSPTAPVQGNDYSADGTRIGLNTWAGCGTTPFNGLLSTLSCTGSGNPVHFDAPATVYFLVKSGGDNLGTTGITISNVSLRRIMD